MPSSHDSPAPPNISDIRRRNLHALFERFSRLDLSQRSSALDTDSAPAGGPSERFSRAIGIHLTQLSHIRGPRSISDKLARQIEANLRAAPTSWTDIVSGWMDQPRDLAALTPVENHVLELALSAYRALKAADKRQLLKLLSAASSSGKLGS